MARVRSYSLKAGLAAGLLLAGLSLGVQPGLAEQGINILMNEAKIVKLARPADTIVVGNPQIADASVQDAHTVILTGKGFGVTNLVILDETGAPLVDEQIFVSRQDARSVRIYRRATVQTLSCTPYCESSYKSEAERTSESEMSVAQ